MASLRPLILAPLVFALGACATQTATQKNPTQALDKLVTDAASASNVVDNSVLRTDNEAAVALRLPRGLVQLQVSCSSEGANWLYVDAPGRLYSVGQSQYREPIPLTSETARTLRSLPQVVQACARTPDWRKLANFESRNDGYVLLDIASVQPQPDGSLKLWAAFDYPSLAYDAPYQAPYGSKVEQLQVNCDQSTYAWLTGYDLDTRERVTDGRVEITPDARAFSSASADYLAILQAACKPHEQLTTLTRAEHRDKPAPDLENQPGVNPDVARTVASLGLGAPRKSLSYPAHRRQLDLQGRNQAFDRRVLVPARRDSRSAARQATGHGLRLTSHQFHGHAGSQQRDPLQQGSGDQRAGKAGAGRQLEATAGW